METLCGPPLVHIQVIPGGDGDPAVQLAAAREQGASGSTRENRMRRRVANQRSNPH
jgi:hypothetical protein